MDLLSFSNSSRIGRTFSFRRIALPRTSWRSNSSSNPLFCLFAIFALEVTQALEHRADNQWQRHGGIVKYFRELPAFFPGHEFPPGNGFGVRASAQPAPAHRLGADAQAVVVALQRQLLVAPARQKFRIDAELLRPVAWHSAAYGE